MNRELMENILYYARKIITVPSGNENNGKLAATAIANLADYGFVIDKQGIEKLRTATREDITDWYYRTAKRFNELAGGNHEYHPFYPNFPEEVIGKTNLELLVDQLMHYFSVVVEDILGETGHAWTPEEENEKTKIKSLEEHPLKVIATIDVNDEYGIKNTVADIFRNTIGTKLTPSPDDVQKIINVYIEADDNWTCVVDTVENRQVLSYLYLRAVLSKKDTETMPKLVANDYLRIVKCYSYMKRNSTFAIPTLSVMGSRAGESKDGKIESMPNSMRRFIIKGLDSLQNLEEDVARNKGAWLIVFKLIHAGQAAQKEYPNLYSVVQKLRNGQSMNTFYSRIEKAYESKDYARMVNLYASRPGEFVKNLNRMLTVSIDDETKMEQYVELVLDKSKKVFPEIRTEDLIRLVAYLRSRKREDRMAVHNVKGRFVIDDKSPTAIPDAVADLFINIAIDSISDQIKTGKSYGKVYVDPALAQIPLPVDITDTTESMNSYPRGTRIPIEKNEDGTVKNIRAFVWWTNIKKNYGFDRVDLDLSAKIYKTDDDGQIALVDTISYYNDYTFCEDALVHSGDETDGGNDDTGVVEFIDINLMKLKKLGIKYVDLYVNAYTGQRLNTVPCLAGWQEREELDKSSQFDVKAVKQTSKLTSGSRGVIMYVIDVENDEIIWLDTSNTFATIGSNMSDTDSLFMATLDRYAKGDQITMKEMIDIAVSANGGEYVDNIEDADVIFSMDAVETVTENQRVITSKNQDVWIGEFMTPQEIQAEEETSQNEDKIETK